MTLNYEKINLEPKSYITFKSKSILIKSQNHILQTETSSKSFQQTLAKTSINLKLPYQSLK